MATCSFTGGGSMVELVAAQRIRLVELVQGGVAREEGQDMVEYALLAALISVVAIAVIVLVGPYLADVFGDIVNGLGTA